MDLSRNMSEQWRIADTGTVWQKQKDGNSLSKVLSIVDKMSIVAFAVDYFIYPLRKCEAYQRE